MMSGKPLDLPYGGACTWQLPPDAHCASYARSVLTSAMAAVAFPQTTVDDGALAVSELATNAYQHAADTDPYEPITPTELWAWARTAPRPELVVAVFDTRRDAMPDQQPEDLMAECGKGLGIVAAVASAWGHHLSRSRLAPQPIPGKATWFALPLPPGWPRSPHRIPSPVAARRLLLLLGARGLQAHRHSDAGGSSLITAGGLNIEVSLTAFSWPNSNDHKAVHPLIDLQATAEHVVQQLEQAGRSTAR